MVRRPVPALEEQPFQADQALGDEVQVPVERDRLQAFLLDVELQMVLQVLADPWQGVVRFDAGGFQPRRVADA